MTNHTDDGQSQAKKYKEMEQLFEPSSDAPDTPPTWHLKYQWVVYGSIALVLLGLLYGSGALRA